MHAAGSCSSETPQLPTKSWRSFEQAVESTRRPVRRCFCALILEQLGSFAEQLAPEVDAEEGRVIEATKAKVLERNASLKGKVENGETSATETASAAASAPGCRRSTTAASSSSST
jgi:hypothetical protein